MYYLTDQYIPGVLLWELWTAAQKPYSGLRNQQVAEKVKNIPCISSCMPQHLSPVYDNVIQVIAGYRLEKPEHCPLQVYEVMRSCWMAVSINLSETIICVTDTMSTISFLVIYMS